MYASFVYHRKIKSSRPEFDFAKVGRGYNQHLRRLSLPKQWRNSVIGWFRRRIAYRTYKKTVNDCLLVLFCGFSPDLLPSLRPAVNLDALMRSMSADGTMPKECSVYATMFLLGKGIDLLNDVDRAEALRAFKNEDTSHKLYKGFNYMLQVVEQFEVSEELKAALGYEVIGKLKGLSREQLDKWRMESQLAEIFKRQR